MDVTLVLTHDCNLGCGYCYAGAKFNKRMPKDIADRSVELAFSDNPKEAQISFFGGEPLLCWDELVRSATYAGKLAKEKGVRLIMSVTTNGTLLTDEKAQILDELGVYVGLSIDGIREAHDAGRPKMGGGSSFDDVKRGLDVLVRRGTPFETISVVSPNNVEWLGASVRWLLAEGVPRIGLNPCFEAHFTDADLELYGKGLQESADLMVEYFRAGRVVSFGLFDNKIMAALKGGLTQEDKCSLGDGEVSVAPSGNMYPCERLVAEDEDHTFMMGNILTGKKVEGEACERGPVNSECGDCGESWRCSSYCACANRAETGKTNVAGGTQCWHERTAAEISDGIANILWEEQNEFFLAWFYGRMTALSEVLATKAPAEPKPVQEVPRDSVRRLPVLG